MFVLLDIVASMLIADNRTILTLFLLLVSSQNLIILTYELKCFVNLANEINYVAFLIIRSQSIYNLIFLRTSTTDFH